MVIKRDDLIGMWRVDRDHVAEELGSELDEEESRLLYQVLGLLGSP